MEAGIPAAQANTVSNDVMALWSLPLLFFSAGPG
jgi:hypothetical protein